MERKFVRKDEITPIEEQQTTLASSTALIQRQVKEHIAQLQNVTDKLNPFYDEFKWYKEK